jgi:hypothetical protein
MTMLFPKKEQEVNVLSGAKSFYLDEPRRNAGGARGIFLVIVRGILLFLAASFVRAHISTNGSSIKPD